MISINEYTDTLINAKRYDIIVNEGLKETIKKNIEKQGTESLIKSAKKIGAILGIFGGIHLLFKIMKIRKKRKEEADKYVKSNLQIEGCNIFYHNKDKDKISEIENSTKFIISNINNIKLEAAKGMWNIANSAIKDDPDNHTYDGTDRLLDQIYIKKNILKYKSVANLSKNIKAIGDITVYFGPEGTHFQIDFDTTPEFIKDYCFGSFVIVGKNTFKMEYFYHHKKYEDELYD